MAITVTLYDTSTLIAVMNRMEDVQHYWLDMYTNEVNSDNEFIDFEKMSDVRRIAPFVAPMAQGSPIYSEGSVMTRVRAAYIKPKDPVSPGRVIKKRAGTGLLDPARTSSLASRFDAIIADITRAHRTAIERRWEWMAARATIDAAVTIVGDAYPERVVNFGRNANQTITLAPGGQWGDTGVSILDLLETWRTRMRRALYGGMPTTVTLGANAWEVARHDPEIRDLLKQQFFGATLGGGLQINLGMRDGLEVEQVARIGNMTWIVYSDYYQDPADGSQVQFMDQDSIVMTGPGMQGYRCFGAILDDQAGFNPVSIFPTQFRENDPPVVFCMAQSAPLMVPVCPNVTLTASVV
jgi:hypothetical protein